MITYSATIIGAPAGQARPRAYVRGVHAGVYSPREGSAAEWRELLLLHFTGHRPACLIHEPVSVAASFRFQRPQGHLSRKLGTWLLPSAPKHHGGKPDLDNLVKLVLDAMVEARVLEDDRCVVRLSAEKNWCSSPGKQPGCTIQIETQEE